jgi:hypothetical protein
MTRAGLRFEWKRWAPPCVSCHEHVTRGHPARTAPGSHQPHGSSAGGVADRSIKTIVVGAHEALPDSLSAGHSMNATPVGEQSGRLAYAALLDARDKGSKQVYLLASHSHF